MRTVRNSSRLLGGGASSGGPWSREEGAWSQGVPGP